MLKKSQGAIKKMDNNEIVIVTDGACYPNPGLAAYAWIILIDKKVKRAGAKIFGFGTNNIAEYTAIVEVLTELVKSTFPLFKDRKAIRVYSDSELAINQIKGIYRIKEHSLFILHNRIKSLESMIRIPITYHHTSNVEIAHNLVESLYKIKIPDNPGKKR